jgi:predicted ATPase
MIKSIEVIGLPRHDTPVKATLNSDLNIITGRNGSGKTTLLKLLWYIISGNIEHAIREVPFTRATIETDKYTMSVNKLSRADCKVELQLGSGDKSQVFEDYYDEDSDEIFSAEAMANDAIKDIGSSLFFPTFRRIEGGFSLSVSSHSPFRPSGRARSDVEEALVALSRRLTVEKHTFVSSISTVDIVSLLMRNYTEMSERSNNLQRETSQHVIDQIKSYKRDSNIDPPDSPGRADVVLDNIKSMIESMDSERAQILAPLDAVRTLAENLFQHSGIKLGSRLSFGDAATAVSSDMLSAGEKQMLSFICYNAFNEDSVIFIDEPELSLHLDWQRQLFPTLQDQGKSNQFIVATHSPFIYSKYPEKEIIMSSDRGVTGSEID